MKPRCKHTSAPTDDLAWHAWAERKAKTHDQRQCPACGLWAVWKRRPARNPNPSPLDLAHQAWADHIAGCTYCRQGRPCDVGDPLDRRLTEAASDDLPWSNNAVSTDT